MLTEASYLSRFFAKFVEIIAAGLATAFSAYVIAYLGGSLSTRMPTPAAVSAGAAALDVAKSSPPQPAPPVAGAAVEEQRPAPQPVTDAPPAQPARKAAKTATSGPVPAPKDIKANTGVAHGEKSAEALARAALANLDADRPPADAPNRRALASTGSAAPAVEFQARPAEMPPPPAAEAQRRRVATVDPLPPNTGSPFEFTSPQPEPPDLFSVPKRILHLLRPGTPSLADEAPRPPMPVATAPRE